MDQNKPHKDVSIWLVPSEDQRVALRKEVDRLAARYGSCGFTPHITAYYLGTSWDDNEVVKLVNEASVGVEQIEVVAEGIDYTDVFTQTLFVKYRVNQAYEDYYQKLRSRFMPSDYRGEPHLSLVYSKSMSNENKEEEKGRIEYPKNLVLDRVQVIVKEGLTIKKEEDVLEWQVVWEGQLNKHN